MTTPTCITDRCNDPAEIWLTIGKARVPFCGRHGDAVATLIEGRTL